MRHFLLPLMLALSSISAFADVPPQSTQDRADGNRLVIDGKPLFISGMNIAWNNFGKDLNNSSAIDEFAFTQYIQDVRKNGGNAIRWWLHNDASYCPRIDNDGKVTGLALKSIESMQKVLDIAYENGVVVAMCLFSHNLLKDNGAGAWSDFNYDRNYKLLTSSSNMDTYIDKALKPILAAVGNHPAVMCWEVFNEPEGMTNEYGGGWSMAKQIPYNDVITFTAKVAVAVHENTKKMVSTGIHEFNKTSYFPKYTDANLKAAAGGNEKAYLDFYMAHWYPQYQGVTTMSPFANTAASWGLGKPIIIGEFPGRSWGPGTSYTPYQQAAGAMTMVDAYKYAYENGYAGALSWSMTDSDFGSITETAPGLKYLYDNHKDAVMIKEVNIQDLTGDLAMKVTFDALAPGDDNEVLLKRDGSLNIAGKTNLVFEIYIDPQSGSNLVLYPAIQTSGDYGWYSLATPINLSNYEKGQWISVKVPLASLKKDGTGAALASGASIYATFFKFVTSNTSPFSGTLYFDNVAIDSDVFSDFNDISSKWNVANGIVSASLVARSSAGTTSILKHATAISLSTLDFSKAQVYNMRGSRVSVSSFEKLKTLPMGVYIVKTATGRVLYTVK